jgi:chemotaxis protein MotB
MAKKKCPEFENHERWLVAYADMMTLLFAVFVVLYAILNVEVEKLKSVTKSVRQAMGIATEDVPDATGKPSGNSRNADDIFNKIKGNTNHEPLTTRNRRERAAIIAADTQLVERTLQEAFQGTSEFPTVSGESSDRVVYFSKDPDGIRISLLARGFFAPSKAELDPAAFRVLDALAATLKGLGRIVRVEGHSDSTATNIQVPFMKNGLSNWELSTLRAATVVRYFVEQHALEKKMVYAAGFGDTRPVAPNDSIKNRSLNRRIDLKVLYEVPSEAVNEMQQPVREEAPLPNEPASQGAKETAPSSQKAEAPKEAPSH